MENQPFTTGTKESDTSNANTKQSFAVFTQKNRRFWGYFWQGVAYTLAISAAWLSVIYLPLSHPIYTSAIAAVIATFVIFAFSFVFNNSSFYDPFWSLISFFMMLYFLDGTNPLFSTRSTLLFIGIVFYTLRLTGNWAYNFQGVDHEDWRYIDLQKKTGKWYWLVSLAGIHFFPTTLTFLGSIPIYYALKTDTNISDTNWLDYVAFIVTFGGPLLSFIADEQMRSFRKNKNNEGKTMVSGVWAFSRHPNYVGETLYWIGLFLFALAANFNHFPSGIGALCIFLMFQFLTVDMMEKRNKQRRPHYEDDTKGIAKFFF